MLSIALKMLLGEKAKFLGLVFGIFLSSFLISQQTAIFLGLVTRSYRLITDIPTVDIWVMDRHTEHMDKIREMPDKQLDVVRSIPGVEWAAPLGFTFLPIMLPNGLFTHAQIVAIDEKSLMGLPQNIVEGYGEDIRRQGGVILDEHAVNHELAYKTKEGKKITLKIGDTFEIADRRAIIVAIAKLTLGFYPEPVLYIGYDDYKQISVFREHHLSFILVRAKPGVDLNALAEKINQKTDLNALTSEGFRWRSIKYFLGTGILINFGLTVFTGFLLGIVFVGNMFHMLIEDNLPYFAMLRALGAKSRHIVKMIFFQAFISGAIGLGLGLGATSLFGSMLVFSSGTVSFLFSPFVIILVIVSVFLICLIVAIQGIQKVLKEDPKMVMVG